MKTLRNIVWISGAGRVFHRRGGETSVARMAPRPSSVTVSQQTALVGGQGHVLDSVDLPGLVGLDRLGDLHGGPAAPPRPIDSGPYEGELETSDRGQGPLGAWLRSWSRIKPAPRWGGRLEITGELEQFLDSRGNRAATAAIVGSQVRARMLTEQPPDVPDRAIGDGQLGRDLGQEKPC